MPVNSLTRTPCVDPTVWAPVLVRPAHRLAQLPRAAHVREADPPRLLPHRPAHLPCEACRRRYKELFATYPIEPFLTSKQSLVTWVVMIHNQVNKRLGKPLVPRRRCWRTTSWCTRVVRSATQRGASGRRRRTPGAVSGTRLSPAAVAACAGGGTIAVLLAFGLWYTIRRLAGHRCPA